MPIITIMPHAQYCPTGVQLQSPVGNTICETLLENNIQIDLQNGDKLDFFNEVPIIKEFKAYDG